MASDTEILETMIDKHGLTYVVAGLVLVCNEKAAHIRTNWQDNITARVWEKDASTLEKTAQNIRSDGVPIIERKRNHVQS